MAWLTTLLLLLPSLLLCLGSTAAANGFQFRAGGALGAGTKCIEQNEAARGYDLFVARQAAEPQKLPMITDATGRQYAIRLDYTHLRDPTCNPAVHAANVAQLLGPLNMHFLLGSTTAQNYAMLEGDMATNASRILYHCCVGPDMVYSFGYKYVFGITVSVARLPQQAIKSMFFTPSIQRLAIAYDATNLYSSTMCKAAIEYAAAVTLLGQHQLDVVSVVSFTGALATPDFFRSMVTNLTSRGIDAFVGCSLTDLGYEMRKAFAAQNVHLKAIYLALAPTNPDFVANVGAAAAEYTLSAAQWHEALPLADPFYGSAMDFSDSYRKAYSAGSATDQAAAAGAVMLSLATAVSKAFANCDISRAVDSDDLLFNQTAINCTGITIPYTNGYDLVQDSLSKQQMATFFGAIEFNQLRRNIALIPPTTQVLKGTIQAVLPLDTANMMLVMPIPQASPAGRFDPLNATSFVLIIVLCGGVVLVAIVLLSLMWRQQHQRRLQQTSLENISSVPYSQLSILYQPMLMTDGSSEPGRALYKGAVVTLELMPFLLAQPRPPCSRISIGGGHRPSHTAAAVERETPMLCPLGSPTSTLKQHHSLGFDGLVVSPHNHGSKRSQTSATNNNTAANNSNTSVNLRDTIQAMQAPLDPANQQQAQAKESVQRAQGGSGFAVPTLWGHASSGQVLDMSALQRSAPSSKTLQLRASMSSVPASDAIASSIPPIFLLPLPPLHAMSPPAVLAADTAAPPPENTAGLVNHAMHFAGGAPQCTSDSGIGSLPHSASTNSMIGVDRGGYGGTSNQHSSSTSRYSGAFTGNSTQHSAGSSSIYGHNSNASAGGVAMTSGLQHSSSYGSGHVSLQHSSSYLHSSAGPHGGISGLTTLSSNTRQNGHYHGPASGGAVNLPTTNLHLSADSQKGAGAAFPQHASMSQLNEPERSLDAPSHAATSVGSRGSYDGQGSSEAGRGGEDTLCGTPSLSPISNNYQHPALQTHFSAGQTPGRGQHTYEGGGYAGGPGGSVSGLTAPWVLAPPLKAFDMGDNADHAGGARQSPTRRATGLPSEEATRRFGGSGVVRTFRRLTGTGVGHMAKSYSVGQLECGTMGPFGLSAQQRQQREAEQSGDGGGSLRAVGSLGGWASRRFSAALSSHRTSNGSDQQGSSAGWLTQAVSQVFSKKDPATPRTQWMLARGDNRMSPSGASDARSVVVPQTRMKLAHLTLQLKRLQHPNCVPVIGLLWDHPLHLTPLLVTECEEYGTLSQVLENSTLQLDVLRKCDIAADIVQAMCYLHSQDDPHLGPMLTHRNAVWLNKNFVAKVRVSLPALDPALRTAERTMSPKRASEHNKRVPQSDIRNPHEDELADVASFAGILQSLFGDRSNRPSPSQPMRSMDTLMSATSIALEGSTAMLDPAYPAIGQVVQACLSDNKRPRFHQVAEMLHVALAETMCDKSMIKAATHYKPVTSTADDMLFEIFPRHVAEALKQGRAVEPESFPCLSIFFSDIIGYTDLCAQLDAEKVMNMLDRLYTKFDHLIKTSGLFKVETIGDAYMAVGNLTRHMDDDHARRLAQFAFNAISVANNELVCPSQPELGTINLRCGLHAGPAVASVVGTLNRRYCLFGSSVNVASRMESNSMANKVHCSEAFHDLVIQQWPELSVQPRGLLTIKGIGLMRTFFLQPPSAVLAPSATASADGTQWGTSETTPRISPPSAALAPLRLPPGLPSAVVGGRGKGSRRNVVPARPMSRLASRKMPVQRPASEFGMGSGAAAYRIGLNSVRVRDFECGSPVSNHALAAAPGPTMRRPERSQSSRSLHSKVQVVGDQVDVVSTDLRVSRGLDGCHHVGDPDAAVQKASLDGTIGDDLHNGGVSCGADLV